jgi:single-strand DNA-binding protein
VTLFGDQAENASKYLAKGREVYVEGRLQTRSYDKEGQKHYVTDIVADRVVFLGGGDGPKGATSAGGSRRTSDSTPTAPPDAPPSDDDVEF